MSITINLNSREAFDTLPDVFFWPMPMVHGCPDRRCEQPDEPDPEWVKAGEPCETCRGRGLYEHPTVRLVHDVTCPDCFGGKPLIAITVPCECPCHDGTGRMPEEVCTECPGTGLVTVGQAVIEHGPLLVHGNNRARRGTEYLWVPTPDRLLLGVVGRNPVFVPIEHPDPASLVGTWGVICRKVQP